MKQQNTAALGAAFLWSVSAILVGLVTAVFLPMAQAIPYWIAFVVLLGIATCLVFRPGVASSAVSTLGGVGIVALAIWDAAGPTASGTNAMVYVLVGGATTILSAISLDQVRKAHA